MMTSGAMQWAEIFVASTLASPISSVKYPCVATLVSSTVSKSTSCSRRTPIAASCRATCRPIAPTPITVTVRSASRSCGTKSACRSNRAFIGCLLFEGIVDWRVFGGRVGNDGQHGPVARKGTIQNFAGSHHPGAKRCLCQALGQGRNESQILEHVLGADLPDKHPASAGIGNRRPEHLFGQRDAERVMQNQPVPVVGQMGLRRVKPLMDGQVILRCAAPFLHRP